MIKRGIERKLTINNNITKYGTVDQKNPTSIFINIGYKVIPDYTLLASIKAIRRRIIFLRPICIGKHFGELKTSIIDYTYPESKYYKPGKETRIAIEFTIFGDFIWNDELQANVELFVNDILSELDSLTTTIYP